jgi:hypothetical protein
MATNPTPIERDIRQIDRQIEGVRSELFRRVGRFNVMNAGSWQLAWDREPELAARHDALFRRRGKLQVERDALVEKEFRAVGRRLAALRRRAARAA